MEICAYALAIAVFDVILPPGGFLLVYGRLAKKLDFLRNCEAMKCREAEEAS